MKKIFIFLAAIVFVGFSCKEEEKAPVLPFGEQLEIDLALIEDYFVDNNITNVLRDCNTVNPPGQPCEGYVSYVLIEEGSGLTPPNLSTQIVVSYAGRLMTTGEQFDASENIEFNLAYLIKGWQAVLLDMQEGDSVTMYIPSGYAYGPDGTSGIPANANLIFEMKLHKLN